MATDPTRRPTVSVAPNYDVDLGAGFAQLAALLRGYDLAELLPWARQQFIEGRTPDEVTMGLRQQEAFRRKYRVIFDREAAGKAPVTVAEVIEFRTRAQQIERMYGMPDGFIDPDRLMLADVSISELGDRVQLASSMVDTRPDVTDQLERLYGLGRGAAIAYALDPESAEPAIVRTFNAAQVAAQSQRQGFGALSRQEAEQLVGLGVDEAAAARGFGALERAGELRTNLEGEQGPTFSREDDLAYVAGGEPAAQKLERRARERRATFAEGGGFLASNDGLRGLGSTM
jgi:hypothetical protein